MTTLVLSPSLTLASAMDPEQETEGSSKSTYRDLNCNKDSQICCLTMFSLIAAILKTEPGGQNESEVQGGHSVTRVSTRVRTNWADDRNL